MNNQWFSKVAVWLVIALVLFTVFKQFDRTTTAGNQIAYSDFLDEVRDNPEADVNPIGQRTIAGASADTQLLLGRRDGYIVAATGRLEVNGVELNAHYGAVIRDESGLSLTAIEDTDFLFVELLGELDARAGKDTA